MSVVPPSRAPTAPGAATPPGPPSRPGRGWRWSHLGPTEKFISYTRWSISGSVLTVALVVIIPLSQGQLRGLAPAPVLAGACALLIVMLAVGMVAVDLRPELNTAPRADHRPWNRASAGMGALVWGGAMVMQGIGPHEGLRVLAIIMGYAALMIFCLVSAPWLTHRWWYSLLPAGLSAAAGQRALGATVLTWSALCVILTFVSVVGLWSVRLIVEAARAQSLETELSLAAERLRIAQELHDTLGQNLAALSLKAELALALARRGDTRLDKELVELGELTRRSAEEMRQVVGGYRSINLATEICGARGLLTAAGVSLSIEGASLDVPEPHRELAAWTVREATTNILRHAAATAVRIRLGPGGVVVTNDGAPRCPAVLSGLEALRRRAEREGADLRLACEPPRFVLALRIGATAEEHPGTTAPPRRAEAPEAQEPGP